MGYRSEVRCLIYGSKENLDAYITLKSTIEGSTVFRQFKGNLTRYTIDRSIGETDEPVHVLDLYGVDWKWYEHYPDVRAWMNFMHEAPEMDLQFEFIRIGEDRNDIEKLSSDDPQYLLIISRPEIEKDFNQLDEIELNI